MKTLEKVSDFVGKYMAAIVIVVAALALLFPGTFSVVKTAWVNTLLGIVMFGMGLTLKPEDFKVVFSRPKDVIIGCIAQFTLMPFLAWALTQLFDLPTELAIGVILVGTCPGGTSSNVMTYLSKGDVALSVGMTAVSTVLAPFLTPLLTLLYAGQRVDVNPVNMFLSIVMLSLRDRSLVTITSLISQGITDNSLKYHLQSAKNNGITRTEAAEIITHIAFYAGWPKAWAAFNLAKEVWNEDVKGEDAKAAFQREMIFPIGEPNTAYAKYFKGNSYLAKISDSQIPFFNVTFEPGCRNNWHTHHATKGGGQMLVGVAGRGWYQEEGKPAQEILPGTVIHIPANVKHWHGAAKESWFAHLAFEIPGENTSNEWQEAVSDEEYNKIK